ncbi:peptidase inhibitor I78 [Phenylobacterium sp.]|jgi:hypothetical protein|uniref:peptidase inhibitor I78 n=1 Tax=Phenylobacterium sp. TaxID=1871053 RepID=UPI002F925798
MRTLPVIGLLALAACAAPPAEAPPPPVRTVTTPPPVATPARDRCGAAELQKLVGRPRSEIPVPVHPERQRVACTTCPVTEDLRADRLNFFFDAHTGLIREIRCG